MDGYCEVCLYSLDHHPEDVHDLNLEHYLAHAAERAKEMDPVVFGRYIVALLIRWTRNREHPFWMSLLEADRA